MGCGCGGVKSQVPDMGGLGVLLQGYGMGSGMGDLTDAFWPSTGEIDTATASLELTVQELGTDIFNDAGNSSDPSYQAFLNAWDTFVNDFDQWRNASYFYNPTRRDDLIDYRKRFNNLLSTYQGFSGAMTVGVQPVSGDTPAPGSLAEIEAIVSKVVVGVVVVGAVVAGVRLLGLARSWKGAPSILVKKNPRRRRRGRR